MKSIILAAAAVGLLAGGPGLAQAQQSSSTTTINGNKPVATSNAASSMPAKGSNSFTMGEAKSRLEKSGFSNVSDLTKDGNGVWRGKAQKDGNMTAVWLDYKGDIGESK
jgi:hypothetical protein